MDNPKYLLKNSYGIYHFRMVVPKRLRPALGQREVKRSLNTKSHGKALRLARRYATFLELLFEQQVVTKLDLAVFVDSFSTVKIAPPRKTKKLEYKLSPKKKKISKPKAKTTTHQTAEEQELETYKSAASLNRVKPSTRFVTPLQPSGKGKRFMSQFLQPCSAIVQCQEESPTHDTAKDMRSISWQR